MEKIKIEDIQLKGPAKTICVVKYNGGKEATLNSKWQSEEIGYLQNKVGIGGEVSVFIVQQGQYTNIKDVDMDSAEPSSVPQKHAQSMPITESERIAEPPQSGLMSSKDEIIVAEVILKAAVEIMSSGNYNMELSFGEEINGLVNELTGAFKLALSNVKAL